MWGMLTMTPPNKIATPAPEIETIPVTHGTGTHAASIDAALGDARAVLADMCHHTDAEIIRAAECLHDHGKTEDERDRGLAIITLVKDYPK